MNTTTLLRFIVCALLACSVVAPCIAKAKKKANPAPTPRAVVISSITANNITVSDQNTTKTITLGPLTEVIVNGQKATLADLKPGMSVNFVLSSPTQATRVSAMTK